MLTRRECRMIAEELHRLQQEDVKKEAPEKFMTMREAAAYTRRSYSYFQKNKKIPRSKLGGRYYYTQTALAKYVINRESQ